MTRRRFVIIWLALAAAASTPRGQSATGLRDPFVSVRPTRASEAAASADHRFPHLSDLAASDVVVSGIARSGDAWLAIVEGAGGASLVAHPGDQLRDAVILRIEPTGMVVATRHGGTGAPGAEERVVPLRALGAARP